jgi:acyl dehydratase
MSEEAVYFEDLDPGRVLISIEREVTADDSEAFNTLTGSSGRVHSSKEQANEYGFSERMIVGPLVLGLSLPLHGLTAEQRTVALLGFESLWFKTPVHPGDRIRLESTVASARPTKNSGRGLVTFHDRVMNQRNDVVMEATRLVLYERRSATLR